MPHKNPFLRVELVFRMARRREKKKRSKESFVLYFTFRAETPNSSPLSHANRISIRESSSKKIGARDLVPYKNQFY